MFYRHILHSDLRQTEWFHSIISNATKFCNIRAHTEFVLHLTTHLSRTLTVWQWTLNKRLKNTNNCDIAA